MAAWVLRLCLSPVAKNMLSLLRKSSLFLPLVFPPGLQELVKSKRLGHNLLWVILCFIQFNSVYCNGTFYHFHCCNQGKCICLIHLSTSENVLIGNLIISLFFLDGEVISLIFLYLCCWIYIRLLNLSASLHMTYFFWVLMLFLGYTCLFPLLCQVLGFVLLSGSLDDTNGLLLIFFFQVFKSIWFVWYLCFSRTLVSADLNWHCLRFHI